MLFPALTMQRSRTNAAIGEPRSSIWRTAAAADIGWMKWPRARSRSYPMSAQFRMLVSSLSSLLVSALSSRP